MGPKPQVGIYYLSFIIYQYIYYFMAFQIISCNSYYNTYKIQKQG